MADGKDAADFVAEHRNDLPALIAERNRRVAEWQAADSFGQRVLARARIEALDRALAAAGIILPSEGGK